MSPVDTSAEAVERELRLLRGRRMGAGQGDTAWDLWAERTETLLRALAAERDAAVRVCAEAAAQFRFYAEQHKAKGTADGDSKARTNEEWADKCERAARGGSDG